MIQPLWMKVDNISRQIVRIIINLFVNSLIPTSFTSISRDLDLPPIPLQSPAHVVERNDKAGDVGLLSAFTSYVSSVMNDEPPEPNDQEIEATLTAVDCIAACRFEEILGNVSELPIESLKPLTLALLAHLPEHESPRVITVKPDLPAPTPVRPNGAKLNIRQGPLYDPAVVYVLELATILALRDEDTIAALGSEVSSALQNVIADADRLHPVALTRTVFYLLSLLRASNDHGYIRAPVVLHAISSFRGDLLKQCAEPVLKGILNCVSGPTGLKNEMATSPDFWQVLHSLAPVKEVAGLVFEITENVTEMSQSAIAADNYDAIVSLLNAFATRGSIGASHEQQQERGPGKKRQQPPVVAEAESMEAKNVVARAVRALTLVSQLSGRVPLLIKQSHLEPDAAWRAYWSPIFHSLATQSCNPCREVRQNAVPALQRPLLSRDLALPGHAEWKIIFSEILIPLINQLLKPEVYQIDPVGMNETRVQSAQLLCKIFVHHLVHLPETDSEGVLDLWIDILEVMDRLMHSGQGDLLAEAVPESLKNTLLVMHSGGYLIAPSANDAEHGRSTQQAKLWHETWTRIERFLPGLMSEIFPAQAHMAQEAPAQYHRSAAVGEPKDSDSADSEAEQGSDDDGHDEGMD